MVVSRLVKTKPRKATSEQEKEEAFLGALPEDLRRVHCAR